MATDVNQWQTQLLEQVDKLIAPARQQQIQLQPLDFKVGGL